jgi:glycosyltransferase involved in cell wall biosynthesis
MERVDVVIPAYNAAASLPTAIESVRAQSATTCRLGRVIVVDDGSTDATTAVAEKFADDVISLQSNGGVAAARNHGVAACATTRVALLDSDDFWYEHHLGALYDAFRATGATLAYSSERSPNRSSGGRRSEYPTKPVDPLLVASTLTGTRSCSSWMIDRESFLAARGFDERFRRLEDFEFVIRHGLTGGRIFEVEAASFEYHPSRLRRRQHRDDAVRALTLLADMFDASSATDATREVPHDTRDRVRASLLFKAMSLHALNQEHAAVRQVARTIARLGPVLPASRRAATRVALAAPRGYSLVVAGRASLVPVRD